MTTRLLHFIWLGSPIPQPVMRNISSWAECHPHWPVQLWTRKLDGMINGDLYDAAPEIVRSDAVWQMRADLMRYEILHRYGGFYADTDTQCRRCHEGVVAERDEFAVAEDANWVANTYLYTSAPGREVLWDMIRRLPAHAANFSQAAATKVTGPQFMTPIWKEHGCFVDQRTSLWFPYSWRNIQKGDWSRVEIPQDAYAVHEWNHQRERQRRYGAEWRAARKEAS